MKRDQFRITAILAAMFIFLIAHVTSANETKGSQAAPPTREQADAMTFRFEDRVVHFIKQLGLGLDRSDLDGAGRDLIKKRAKDLDKATIDHRTQFDLRDNWFENKEEIRRCMTAANEIDRAMQGHTLGTSTDSNWSRLLYELNGLAAAYGLPPVGSTDYN